MRARSLDAHPEADIFRSRQKALAAAAGTYCHGSVKNVLDRYRWETSCALEIEEAKEKKSGVSCSKWPMALGKHTSQVSSRRNEFSTLLYEEEAFIRIRSSST